MIDLNYLGHKFVKSGIRYLNNDLYICSICKLNISYSFGVINNYVSCIDGKWDIAISCNEMIIKTIIE